MSEPGAGRRGGLRRLALWAVVAVVFLVAVVGRVGWWVREANGKDDYGRARIAFEQSEMIRLTRVQRALEALNLRDWESAESYGFWEYCSPPDWDPAADCEAAERLQRELYAGALSQPGCSYGAARLLVSGKERVGADEWSRPLALRDSELYTVVAEANLECPGAVPRPEVVRVLFTAYAQAWQLAAVAP